MSLPVKFGTFEFLENLADELSNIMVDCWLLNLHHINIIKEPELNRIIIEISLPSPNFLTNNNISRRNSMKFNLAHNLRSIQIKKNLYKLVTIYSKLYNRKIITSVINDTAFMIKYPS